MPYATDLPLSLSESNKLVEVRIEHEGKSLLHFSNETPPAVKVIGYRKPSLTKDQLLEFAAREADFFDSSQSKALRKLASSQDMQIYNHVRELRKIMQKMLMLSERAKLTKQFLKKSKN